MVCFLQALRMELYWSGSSMPSTTHLNQQHHCQATVALLLHFYLLGIASIQVPWTNQSGFVASALTPSFFESQCLSLTVFFSFYKVAGIGNLHEVFPKSPPGEGAHLLLKVL
jgi:hypothetical protein